MRDPKRIKRILSKIEAYWNTYPDMRFCQMLINLGLAQDNIHHWHIDDGVVETILSHQDKWIKKEDIKK